ncbi:MAG TPA: hypothetical protein VJT71_14470 [Pyrinomonadaceae bacterium]|nr:hypothetical protein [Pyrinomonadaceae bacterium]
MVTREEILNEVRKVPDKYLDELYQLIKEIETRPQAEASNQNVMAALRRIRISASPDFSTQADLYNPDDSHAR